MLVLSFSLACYALFPYVFLQPYTILRRFSPSYWILSSAPSKYSTHSPACSSITPRRQYQRSGRLDIFRNLRSRWGSDLSNGSLASYLLSSKDLQALSPSQLHELQQNLLEEAAERGPLIGHLVSIDELRAQYEGGSMSFVRKIDWLRNEKGFKGIRRTRGDGDCFYRCMILFVDMTALSGHNLTQHSPRFLLSREDHACTGCCFSRCYVPVNIGGILKYVGRSRFSKNGLRR